MIRMIHAEYVQAHVYIYQLNSSGWHLFVKIGIHHYYHLLSFLILYFSPLPPSSFSPLSSSFSPLLFLALSFFFSPLQPALLASMLPWQRPYRKSLLPRPQERSSFHRGRRDGEMERWRERDLGYSAPTALEVSSSPFPQADSPHPHQSNSRLHTSP